MQEKAFGLIEIFGTGVLDLIETFGRAVIEIFCTGVLNLKAEAGHPALDERLEPPLVERLITGPKIRLKPLETSVSHRGDAFIRGGVTAYEVDDLLDRRVQ